MEHEKVRIPAFHRQPINSMGSIGYVSGNVPYLCYSEGIDNLRILQGQVLPCKSQKAELWNPFSYPADMQIIRGAQVDISGRANSQIVQANLSECRSGVILKAPANGGDAAGRRRGVGFIAKRGVYNLSILSNAGLADDSEYMILKNADWKFMNFRPAASFANQFKMVRPDGSENSQLVGIYGSYTQAEIDAWKASLGYSGSEVKGWWNQSSTISVNSDTAVFFTNSDAFQIRFSCIATELGDTISGLREV